MARQDSFPVPESNPQRKKQNRDNDGSMKAPLSGSKKTKQRNHVSHNNPEG
ncbi:small acid-soluble spore protein P [Paenibacillus prosopidis]|uniref:Small acid-soluble spore protein P (Minor) n=1 Tax=Paenibacillus prosopidis TaxID=630520 RepID=A0A368VIQ9_9BACL|nr:small acid-soluble spore protein P [Paenibacillus prosopidis]RCW41181.1 small acid-soluble spore protein P (minor) [Paenibacillus prosopidis]